MSKRHKHVKPSGKKSLSKAVKRKGSRHPQKNGVLKGTRKRKAKPISKSTKVSKGRKVSSRARNKHTQKPAKRVGRAAPHRKGAKKTRQTKGKVRGEYVERLKRKKQIEREIERLREESENLDIENLKRQATFSNKRKPIGVKRWIQEREGQKLKEKNIKGYRYVYYFKFPSGTFEQKTKYIREVDLSFLTHALERAVVAPRAVRVTLESKTDDGRRRYFHNVSAVDFVVNLVNIKKHILETMIEWQDKWALGVLDRGETYMIEYEEYNPDYLYSVSIQFIY